MEFNQSDKTHLEWAWISEMCRGKSRLLLDHFQDQPGPWPIETILPFAPPCPAFCARVAAWLAASPLHHFVPIWSSLYPPLLREIPTPPLGLYVMGQVPVLSSRQMAMVGTRKPTPLGEALAGEFARGLARAGFTITSGLAMGVDGEAHRGALAAGGPTIGVMATGIDYIYPLRHRKMAQAMLAQGAIITEFALGTKPLPAYFPQRNRIISGLSQGVLVVEATLKSGTLTTARHAVEQNREVFAIPGSIKNRQTEGCHLLIKQGAKLVETLDDILMEIGLVRKNNLKKTGQNGINCSHLEKEDQLILAILETETVGVDELISRLDLPAQEVACRLVELELRGLVQAMPGGYTRAWRAQHERECA